MTSRGADTAAAAPIETDEFGRRMVSLGAFEKAPDIAVAVSGGPDSLCLALLMHRWTDRIGGRTIGLIVDHGLRQESHDEALTVERQLLDLGAAAQVLSWTADKPQTNIQAAARDARYALLLDWCRAHDVIHLAVGHHAADQAETHLLRRRASSGVDGLAGMASVTDRGGARIIRPFLNIAPERIRATLRAAGLSWIEDPSNRDTKYTRTSVRQEIRAANTVPQLCAEARRYSIDRRAADHRIASLLAKSVKLFPTGYAVLSTDFLADLEPGDARRCLAHIVACIGALDYPPRTARLEALRAYIIEGAAADGRTLGGCLLLRQSNSSLLVCREPSAAREIAPVTPGSDITWDGRFRVHFDRNDGGDAPITVRRLEDRAWGTLRQRFPDDAAALVAVGGLEGLPARVRAALPVLCDLDGPVALPHLPKQCKRPKSGHFALRISFQPRRPLAGPSFVVDGG